MALKATIHNVDVEISDVDRGVYESLDLHLARQPSETAAYMATRLLAYCLEYREGIAFTEGVAAGDQPAVWARDLTGRLTAWIDSKGYRKWTEFAMGSMMLGLGFYLFWMA